MFASMALRPAHFEDGSESGDEAVDWDLEPAVHIGLCYIQFNNY
jgi:hypothetical protein